MFFLAFIPLFRRQSTYIFRNLSEAHRQAEVTEPEYLLQMHGGILLHYYVYHENNPQKTNKHSQKTVVENNQQKMHHGRKIPHQLLLYL
ncbi:unnamed protein product [Ectocarpus sp. 6 AP-2014]